LWAIQHLGVQALGGSLSYQWSNNVSRRYSGATNATLTLTNVALTDAGTTPFWGQYALDTPRLRTVDGRSLTFSASLQASSARLLNSVGGANGALVPPNGGTAAPISSGLSLPGGGGGGFPGYVSLPWILTQHHLADR